MSHTESTDLPSTNGTNATKSSNNNLMAYMKLMRIGNVFTAFANILMGFLVVQADTGVIGLTTDDLVILVALLASTFGLYSAGMVLNDVFDVERDRAERQNRPIPEGQISLAAAQKLGWSLLIFGIFCSLAAGKNGVIIAF